MSIEAVGAELRRRRRALVGYEQPTREGWEADLVTYDHLLARAATMLDVLSAPQTGVEPLTAAQRERLETSLAGAGMDVRTDDL